MNNHHNNVQSRDQLQAMMRDKLDNFVSNARQLREQRQEKFGHVDQYRIVRDQAERLHKMDSHARSLLLSLALDRLAQLPDLDLTSDLEALLTLDDSQENPNV